MDSTSKTTRFILFFILATVAYLTILSQPDDNASSWLSDFFISKAIGFSAIYGMYRLHRKTTAE